MEIGIYNTFGVKYVSLWLSESSGRSRHVGPDCLFSGEPDNRKKNK